MNSSLTPLNVFREPKRWRVVFSRPRRKNSIDRELLVDLHAVLDAAEADDEVRLLILEGQGGVFCTGMDFKEAAQVRDLEALADHAESRLYLRLLQRFASSRRVIVANIDGTVMAGGVGVAAACDLVVCTPRSTFSLPEALWGLLPAQVLPSLIRRIGLQAAYRMTLTTLPVSGEEAAKLQLADVVTDDPNDAIRQLMLRLVRIDPVTMGDLKAYMRRLWIVTDEMESGALDEFIRLIQQPRVRDNIRNFVEHQTFPWNPPSSA